MRLPIRRRIRLFVHHGVFVVLLAVLVTFLAFLAHEHRIERDLTQTSRNTLSAPMLDVLRQLDAPLRITAFAMAKDARGDSVHARIQDFLRPYRRVVADMSVTMVDPREQPRAAASAGVRAPVELVVEYKQRTEHLTEFTEQAFANLLMRLIRGAEAHELNQRLRAKYIRPEFLPGVDRAWDQLDDVAIEVTPRRQRSWTGAALHEVTQHELNFWQSVARATAYAIYLALESVPER